MTEQAQVLNIINEHYPLKFDNIEFVRDSGCVAYTVYSDGCRYFLRVTKPMFFDKASKSLDIHLFLQKQGFAVPQIIFTKEGLPCVQGSDKEGDYFYVLYEFVEGEEVNPEQDAEKIGAFIGRMHKAMKGYPGQLVKNGRYYYVDRYINIMRTKQYDKIDEFIAYGEELWEKVKDLPYGYCHGDMYRGNILKTPDGRLYILDFDTSCEGFPMYDPALICNITDYFELEDNGYVKSKNVYERFLPEYLKYSSLSKAEIESFYDLIALYHFALQATIIEIFGMNCVDNEFFDRQLRWLHKWKEQCEKNKDSLVVTTEKLLLKTVTITDIDEVARMWNYPNGNISYQEAQNAIDYMCSNHKKNEIGKIYHLCFAVYENANEDKIIGWCGIDGKSDNEKTVLFYAIDEQYRNKGYATQCANALLKYAFETLGLDVLYGGCDKANIAFYKVMKKIGMNQNSCSQNGDPLFYIDKEMYFK